MEYKLYSENVRYRISEVTLQIIEELKQNIPRLNRPDTFYDLNVYTNVDKPKSYDEIFENKTLRTEIEKKSDKFLRKEIAPLLARCSNMRLEGRIEPYFYNIYSQRNYCRCSRLDKNKKRHFLCFMSEQRRGLCKMCYEMGRTIPKTKIPVLPPPVKTGDYDKKLEGQDALVSINIT